MSNVTKFVTENEVNQLLKAAKQTRNPIRNELIILMLYRHGLRESELCNLEMDDLVLDESRLRVRRLKGGSNSVQPIEGDELRLIRKHLRTENTSLPWLFLSEQKTQLSRKTIIALVDRCSKLANIKKVTPHMFRHGCGYYLVNKGINLRVIQSYLGHKDISNTSIYTELNAKQFKNLWS